MASISTEVIQIEMGYDRVVDGREATISEARILRNEGLLSGAKELLEKSKEGCADLLTYQKGLLDKGKDVEVASLDDDQKATLNYRLERTEARITRLESLLPRLEQAFTEVEAAIENQGHTISVRRLGF
jgi:hypothetical protein